MWLLTNQEIKTFSVTFYNRKKKVLTSVFHMANSSFPITGKSGHTPYQCSRYLQDFPICVRTKVCKLSTECKKQQNYFPCFKCNLVQLLHVKAHPAHPAQASGKAVFLSTFLFLLYFFLIFHSCHSYSHSFKCLKFIIHNTFSHTFSFITYV